MWSPLGFEVAMNLRGRQDRLFHSYSGDERWKKVAGRQAGNGPSRYDVRITRGRGSWKSGSSKGGCVNYIQQVSYKYGQWEKGPKIRQFYGYHNWMPPKPVDLRCAMSATDHVGLTIRKVLLLLKSHNAFECPSKLVFQNPLNSNQN